MREVGQNLGIPLFVFGPETHMTAIVGMALGKRPIPSETEVEFSTANFLLPGGQDKVLLCFSPHFSFLNVSLMNASLLFFHLIILFVSTILKFGHCL
jgi:ATP citrate lyase citrate-binding